MTSKNYIGGDHKFSASSSWSPTGAPKPGDTVTIYSGTVTAANLDIANEQIYLQRYGQATLDLVLQKTQLDPATKIMTVGEGYSVTIDSVGQVTSAGLIVSEHGELDLDIGSSSTTSNFVNSGTIHGLAGIGSTTVDISVSKGSKFTSSGRLLADGGGNTPGGIIGIVGAGSVTNSGLLMASDGTVNVSVQGNLVNSGSIISQGAGTFAGKTDITFGAGGFTNTGLIENGYGAAMSITAAGGGQLINKATIENSGSMTLNTAVQQSAQGTIQQDGGTLTLGAAVTSGTIAISSGMLDFGGSQPWFAYPASLNGFTAKLDFTGASADLKFQGSPSLTETLKGNHLYVYESIYSGAASAQIADFQLTGGGYSASSFSAHGDTIHFAKAVPS